METQMPGGYTGRILRIDLTTERIWTETLTPEECRYYLGAVGIGYKILWEEVPPETAWDDPENRLFLGSGPLAGTPVWGTGSLTVVTRGAMTGGAVVTNAQGFFGANLKYCGYDGIVLQGQASRWVYVHINDDVVELRDASHLLGKDTWETQDLLQGEYGLSGHQMSVYGIGPAGEKLVRWAIIEGDYGHVASKNGCGAVMGKKGVKCIAIVRGSKGVGVHDPAGLMQAADMISHEVKGTPTYEYGTLNGPLRNNRSGALSIKNLTTNIYPVLPRLDELEPATLRGKFPHRGHQCSGCGMKGHCHILVVPEGNHEGTLVDEAESEGIAMCGPQIGSVDTADMMWLNTQVDKAGVDVNEFGWVIGWVMECYEKGYITKEQLGGLEMRWGDSETANTLLQMITHREGFGDLLAEGVKRAAERLGGEAYDCAVFVHKGTTPRGHDHRGRWSEMLDGCVTNIGTIEGGGQQAQEFGLPETHDPFNPEEVAYMLAAMLGKRNFVDALGVCSFTVNTYVELICQALNALTGWDYTKEEAMEFGKRSAAMFRLFNLRCGIGVDLERPSERYWSTPIDGPAAGTSAKANWETMVSTYYKTAGWDRETGKPLPETMRELGLQSLMPEVWGLEEAKVGV